jgi:TP901 family phage tail tape measure protein
MADLGNTISLNASRFAAGVAETRAKLTELNTAFVENRNRMKELNKEAKDLQKQEQELSKEMKNGGTAEQRQQLQQLHDRMAQVNAEIGTLRTREQELRSDISQTNRELQEQRGKTSDLSEAFSQLGQLFAGLGIAEACHQIADAFGECVHAAADFEATMSTVEALSGATASQMQELTDKAKDLGATTKFTATESAQAMTFMGMAGWDATQMLNGMDGVLDLAAASGTDLAMTADIITDALTAFGLKAEDTTHFADVLAATATNSNTSVEIMGETFKNCASVAGALGYSIEDVSAAVGLMANAGVKGTIAGTALKNTFNGLLNGAKLSAEAFGEVEVSAVNADGTMKNFGDTMNELRGYFEQMTEAERVMNAMDIAGKYGYNGLLAIVNSTQQDFEKLTDSINECEGAASRMAEVKMDNLSGQVTLMNSAMDALKNTIGGAYDDELKELAKGFTEVLTATNDFLAQNPEVTRVLVAMTGAVVAMITAFAGYKVVTAAAHALSGFGVAAGTTLATMGAITVAVGAWTVAIDKLKLAFGEVSKEVKAVRSEVESLGSSVEKAVAGYEVEADMLRRKVEKYEELRQTQERTEYQEKRLSELAEEIEKATGGELEAVNKLNGGYNDLSSTVEEYIKTQSERVKKAAMEDAAREAYQKQIEIDHQLEAEAERHGKKVEELRSAKGNIFTDWYIESQLQEETTLFLNNMASLRESQKIAKETTDEFEKSLDDLYASEEQAAKGAETVSNGITNIGNAFKSASPEELTKQVDELTKSASSLVKEYGTLYDSVTKLRNGEALNYEQMQDLLKIYPDISKYIKVTADGYTVEIDAIDNLNNALDDNLQKRIEHEKKATYETLRGWEERKKIIEREIATSAQAAANDPMARAAYDAAMSNLNEANGEIADLYAKLNTWESTPSYMASGRGKSSKTSSNTSGSSKSTIKEKDPPGLKSLMSYAKTASEAFKEIEEDGELALSTVQALIDAGYGDALYKDGNKWKIYTEEVKTALGELPEGKKTFEELFGDQIETAKSVENATSIEKDALDTLGDSVAQVTDGIYGLAKAKEELRKPVELGSINSDFTMLSKAVAEQNAGDLSSDTIAQLSGSRYSAALDIDVDGKITLNTDKLKALISDELDAAINDLNTKLETAEEGDIPGLSAQIQAFKNLKAVIDEVVNGLYGIEKAQEKIVSDEALKATEDAANRRLKQIDAELKAKQKLRDETLKAIDDEVQARKRLTEDNDIQRQIDQAMAQLNYSQLDEFSRAQLERKIRSLKNDKADMLWERGIEDRRAAVNKEYDSSAEELNAEKDAINNSLEVLRELNDQVAAGTAEIVSAIKEAIENQTPGKTPDITFNFADSLSADQIIKIVKDYYGE